MNGLLVAAAVLLHACGTQSPEGTAGAVDPAVLRTTEQALRGNCSVTVECGDGTTISCQGSASACSSGFDSWYGLEYVDCNGSHTHCPSATGYCKEGKRCRTTSDCGVDGVCTAQGICACYQ